MIAEARRLHLIHCPGCSDCRDRDDLRPDPPVDLSPLLREWAEKHPIQEEEW